MKRPYLIVLAIGIFYAVFLLLIIPFPGDTDAYYHYNASQRLASGEGLTDPYLWNYLYTPDALPAPAYNYWMPLYTLLASPLMIMLGTGFKVALLPTLLSWLFFALAGVYIMERLGGNSRQQIMTGILMYFPGILAPAMATTDVDVLYGALGVWCLIFIGRGYGEKKPKWLIIASVLGAFAGLTRNDGILLVGLAVLFAFLIELSLKNRLRNTVIVGGVALVILLPWYIRNYIVMNTPFSQGGLGTIFVRDYDEIFSVDPEMDVQQFWDWGLTNILQSRWDVFKKNALDFILLQGFLILMPFALYTWWQQRRNKFVSGFSAYAVLLHIAMTLFFAFPGKNGALMHSASALMPFWGAFGLIGINGTGEWLGARFNWSHTKRRAEQMSFGVVSFVVVISLYGLLNFQKEKRLDYEALQPVIDDDSRVMVFDPVEFYYFTDQMGVILPNDTLEVAQEIAWRYCIRYLMLTDNVPDGYLPLMEDRSNSTEFLKWVANVESNGTDGDVVVYEFIDIPQQCEMENE